MKNGLWQINAGRLDLLSVWPTQPGSDQIFKVIWSLFGFTINNSDLWVRHQLMKSSSPEESNPPGQSFWKHRLCTQLPRLELLSLPVIEMVRILPIPGDLCSEIHHWLPEDQEGLAPHRLYWRWKATLNPVRVWTQYWEIPGVSRGRTSNFC